MSEAATELGNIPNEMRGFVLWLVHAGGDPAVAAALRWSPEAVHAGAAALRSGAPILTDSRMVAAGINRANLAAGTTVMCPLERGGGAGAAARGDTTRSAAAVERWRPWLGGSIVAVGNAPTALFRLLEGLRNGFDRPALIIGFPAGFVGAAEAKDLLAASGLAPYITVAGRRGGSALAAAAVNALARQDQDGMT